MHDELATAGGVAGHPPPESDKASVGKRVTNVSIDVFAGPRAYSGPDQYLLVRATVVGAACRNRTDDLLITSETLYRLS